MNYKNILIMVGKEEEQNEQTLNLCGLIKMEKQKEY